MMRPWTTAILMAGLLTLAACTGQSETSGPKRIQVGLNLTQTNLDPAQEWNGWYVSMYGIGETLVRFDSTMTLQPSLAQAWSKTDALTWTFTIREGVTFHNGKPLSAEAVKAALDRAVAANPRAKALLDAQAVVAQGQSLTITTNKPQLTLLGNLADPIFSIIDVQVDEASIPTSPVGTGPFQLAAYTEGLEVSVKRYDRYWGGPALLDEATFKYIKDDNTRAMALQAGEIDVANNVSVNNLSLFENKDAYRIETTKSLRIVMAYINFQNPFLADPGVRAALAHGIDAKTYGRSLLKGTAQDDFGVFPSSLPFGGIGGQAFSPKEAVDLLAKAGYHDTDGDGIVEKNGKPLTLRLGVFATRAEIPVIGEAMQADLRKVGIDVKIETYESVNTVLKSGDFDLSLYNVNTATTGDPYAFLALTFGTKGPSNFGHYTNPQVDSLLEQLAQEPDTEKRRDLAVQIQKLVRDDNADLFIVNPMSNRVVKAGVTGMAPFPIDFYMVDNKVNVTR